MTSRGFPGDITSNDYRFTLEVRGRPVAVDPFPVTLRAATPTAAPPA